MSHIYEALQRAEAERKAGAQGVATATATEHLNLEFVPAAAGMEAEMEAGMEPGMEPGGLDLSSGAPHGMTGERKETPAAAELQPAVAFSPLRAANAPDVLSPALALGSSFLGNVPRRPWNPLLERLPSLHRGGVEVEQFRGLRSRVQEFRDLKKLKSILVTSGLPQEGKSFIAVNLAINLARHKNSRVLLIDGDMRRSTMHQYLGSSHSPGLPEYLSGKADLLEVMQFPEDSQERDPMMNAVLNNLALIPGGEGGDMAADLTASKRFSELLTAMEPYFDWILIDSPPVLLVSDAVNMARSSDAVLLVARSGVTTFPTAQRAQQELRAANVIGFVLNASDKPSLSGSYYYHYENGKA